MICRDCEIKKSGSAVRRYHGAVALIKFDTWGYPVYRHEDFCCHTLPTLEEKSRALDRDLHESELNELKRRYPDRTDLHLLKTHSRIPLHTLILHINIGDRNGTRDIQKQEKTGSR